MRWVSLVSALLLFGCSTVDVLGTRASAVTDEPPRPGIPNVLQDRQKVPLSQVNARLNDAFIQLFFGDPQAEAVFFDQGDGTGYVQDIANDDVRTDSMGYGMLVTAQLNQREVFDKLWAWAKTHMQSQSGPSQDLLFWRCETSGDGCLTSAATDASSIIITALFLAETRWGRAGAHPYGQDALTLLDAMTDIEERNGGVVERVVNCFNRDAALPRRSSMSPEEDVDTDYLMPAFYEMWALHDTRRADLWLQMAENARALLSTAGHRTTGLLPEAISYAGNPVQGRDGYRTNTSRSLLNLFLDHTWHGPFPWIVAQNERRLDFFLGEGIEDYVAEYSLSGDALISYNTVGHRALVALSAGTSTNPEHDIFLEELLAQDIPTGTYRYYDGMLYILSLLALSGQLTPH